MSEKTQGIKIRGAKKGDRLIIYDTLNKLYWKQKQTPPAERLLDAKQLAQLGRLVNLACPYSED